MKQIGLEITTSLGELRSRIGTQDGERGLATQSNTKAAMWLSRQSPEDVDKAAVSRALSHGVSLTVKMEGRYPTGENGEYLPSYSVASGCDIHGTNESREKALADLRNFMATPDVRDVEMWLAELSVITAGRGREGIDAALMVNAYSSRLARFPADVVRYAVLVKTWKWFPSWDELEKVCETKTGPRRHMIAALSSPEPDPEPTRREPTQDERDRVQAMVDEMFPNVSQEWRDAATKEAMKGKCMKETT